MPIKRQTCIRYKIRYKVLLFVTFALVSFSYAIYLFLSPVYVTVNLSSTHRNVRFTSDTVYFFNGAAYDFYSIDELTNRSGAGLQWKIFPLPDDQLTPSITPWTPKHSQRTVTPLVDSSTTSEASTGLAFVDRIYIASTPKLMDRQDNLKRMFTRYQIGNYEWRMKWTQDTCYAPENREEIYRKINLRTKSIMNKKLRRQCAITMEHIDIWHDIVARNSSLSLILEDDAVFISNFPEKFNRTIYTAIRTGLLKIGGLSRCIKSHLSANSNEWFEQDPMIVIGSCMEMFDNAFARQERNAPPMLSTHKQDGSRCSHAYLLTACSAAALLRQIATRKTTFLQSDLLLNALVVASPTLQSFWLDPPIVYQGNRIIDLDGILSFRRTTY